MALVAPQGPFRQLVAQAGVAKFGFVNSPPKLFKFFAREEHAQALAERGEIRVGTLHEFRATDGWDSVRGDPDEGRFTISLESAEPETITMEAAPWYLRDIIKGLGMPVLSRGGAINAIPDHVDAYIFCSSAVRSPDAQGPYGRHCVEIHDVVGFFTLLTRHLTEVLRVATTEPHGFLAPCLYLDRNIKLTSVKTEVPELPLAFIKSPHKRNEQEVRAIWHPVKRPPEPIITACEELTGYCAYDSHSM